MKNIEIKHSYRETKDSRRKSKVFCMYGTVAFRSPIPFLDRRATDLQLGLSKMNVLIFLFPYHMSYRATVWGTHSK